MKRPALAIGVVSLGVLLIGALAARADSLPLYPDTGEPERLLIMPISEPAVATNDNTVPESAPPTPPAEGAAAEPAAPAPADAPTPWKLPQPCFFQNHRITMGGWLEQGITGNAWNPADRSNGPVATNDRSGEYQLNQFWLYFDRPTKTDGCGWDIGGHIDMSYGTDWRFGDSLGLESRIDSPNSFYGLVIPQFFLEVAYNDLTVKAGHYAANFGYENVPAVANFFYSHCYALAYGEPILVTGVQADYKLDQHWTATAGVHRGWAMFEDNNGAADFLGGVRYSTCDKRTTVSFMIDNGSEDPAGINNQTDYSLVFQHTLSEKLTYVFQHDLGTNDHGDLRTGGPAQWYDVNQYLLYTINKKWSAGLRGEWFRDQEGTRVAGVGAFLGSGRGWQALPGFAGDFYEATLGLNWRPNLNVVLRPEIRYDWYNGTTNLQGQLPFNNGTAVDQLTFGTDLIVTF